MFKIEVFRTREGGHFIDKLTMDYLVTELGASLKAVVKTGSKVCLLEIDNQKLFITIYTFLVLFTNSFEFL